MKACSTIVSGSFFGAEIEPGVFHGAKIEAGTFHREEIPPVVDEVTPPDGKVRGAGQAPKVS